MLVCLGLLVSGAQAAVACNHDDPPVHHVLNESCCSSTDDAPAPPAHECSNDCNHNGCPCMHACHTSHQGVTASWTYQPLLTPLPYAWCYPGGQLPMVHLSDRVPPKIGDQQLV
ncbi:hypothetical protein MKQ68_09585 [Chitinophaga horti]|uniref:Secreted protein n=1 Tax=Chitinophaga horti TaxID=2920382 RepID=A0ABY6J6P3_9BACT|nr:hypothetical protein [Chitinophaga horti]UYQ95348.1 hypothetical protein MKQ68_09585 [Chitinophaga horti]